MEPVRDAVPPCDHSYVGPLGIVWDCVAPQHETDPAKGIAGSGHVFHARPRCG